METLEKKILQDYFVIIGKRYFGRKFTRIELLDPDLDILDELFDFCMTYVNNKAEEMYYERKSDIENAVYFDTDDIPYKDEEIELYAHIIKCASIAMLLNLTEEREHFLNAIMNNDIDTLYTSFKHKTGFAYRVFREYINYNINTYFGTITAKDKSDLQRKFPFLKSISSSKGYMTLNDKARNALKEFIDMLLDVDLTSDKVFIALDEYFRDSNPDYIIKRYAVEFATSKNNIRLFKAYQVRMLLSEVYLKLKTEEIMNGEEPSPITSFIEDSTEVGIANLPEDSTLRYEIYDLFCFHLYAEKYRKFEQTTLIANECIDTVKRLNPIYFLD